MNRSKESECKVSAASANRLQSRAPERSSFGCGNFSAFDLDRERPISGSEVWLQALSELLRQFHIGYPLRESETHGQGPSDLSHQLVNFGAQMPDRFATRRIEIRRNRSALPIPSERQLGRFSLLNSFAR